MPVTWKGSAALQKTPESDRWHYNYGAHEYVRIYEGPESVCLASRPSLGGTIEGTPGGLTVVDVSIEPSAGGKATMTILLAGPPEVAYEEIDRSQIQMKIEANPRYEDVSPEELQAIEGVLSAQPGEYDAALAYVTSNLGLELLTKRLRGEDSYLFFAPIARRTSFLTFYFTFGGTGPSTSGVGTIGPPTFTTGVQVPSGWQWLKSADRLCNRPGYLERVEEWLGAVAWDVDLYS